MVVAVLACATRGTGTKDPYADLVWPPPPDEPRIQLEAVIRGRADVEASSNLRRRLLGAAPLSPYDWLQKPFAVAFDAQGRILVTDSETAALIRFDRAGRRMDVLGTRGRVQLKLPLGLDAAPDGTIYVADAGRRQVVAFGPDGNLEAVYGRQGELLNPTDAALSPDGSRLYVADSQAHRIVVFDPVDGRLLSSFGQRGEGDGEFSYPTSLAFGRDGSLFVVDQINSRVQRLDPEGRFLDQFGSLGVGFAGFVRPKDVAIDEVGWVYVSDNAFNNFQLFDRDYRLLTFVGEGGPGPGRFLGASGVAVQGERIAVVDQLGARLQVFRFLVPKAEEALWARQLAEPATPLTPEVRIAVSREPRQAVEPRSVEGQAGMTPAGGAAEPGSAHSNHKAVLDTVRAWSRAWAEQRVADYLAFYSPGFELAAGIGRSAWQETRRDRLIRPQYIDIALDEIQIRFEARNQARVEFVQSYRSDRFADRVRKTLQLVLESAGWRILRETVEEVL